MFPLTLSTVRWIRAIRTLVEFIRHQRVIRVITAWPPITPPHRVEREIGETNSFDDSSFPFGSSGYQRGEYFTYKVRSRPDGVAHLRHPSHSRNA